VARIIRFVPLAKIDNAGTILAVDNFSTVLNWHNQKNYESQ
jgi:hypothetical protein